MYRRFVNELYKKRQEIRILEAKIVQEKDEEERNKLIQQKMELEGSMVDQRSRLNYGI